MTRKRNSYRRTRVSKHPEPWGLLSRDGVNSILESMNADQREHHYRNLRPSYLKFRGKVAEWILDLGEYFDLHPTTTHAAIAYMDRIQPNEKFCAFQWQMVAICCITISAKYNELEEDVPDLASFSALIQQEIPRHVHLEYELWVLKQMGWKLNARVPLAFLHSYDCMGVVFASDLLPQSSENQVSSHQLLAGLNSLRTLMNKQFQLLSTMCLLDPQFKPFPSSLVAASILYVARKRLGLEISWPTVLREMTRVDISECRDIVQLVEIVSNDIISQLTPAMSTMTISPVRVPPSHQSHFQTPTQNYSTHHSDELWELGDFENKGSKGVGLHARDVSPFSVAAVPSPVI